jgi:hypothetical protein
MGSRVESLAAGAGTRVGRTSGGSTRVLTANRHPRPLGLVLPLLVRLLLSEYASRRHANGERSAGLVVGRLPEGWRVVHDVPIGDRGATIDHVVVGPTGTFTLSAKDLTGKVWVGARSVRHNGHPTDFVSKATCEASLASELLSAVLGRPIEVRGVLAILADEWTVDDEPVDVRVGSPRGVKDWMVRLPVTLSAREVIEIAAAARTSHAIR